MEKAVVYNVMHYGIHDGPGIRTTVFLKGCPLSCKWCHNPESIDPKPQRVFNQLKCIKCNLCNDGVDGGKCPTGARETIGYEIGVPGLMKEINKDRIFYEQSGGGVTFSGGEPFYQAQFLIETLIRCREECINTAVDTCGYCDTGAILEAAEITGYFLYDIKFMDNARHVKFCGAPNDIILKNLESLSDTKTKLLLRIPVVPGVNDDMAEMKSIFEFTKNMKNIEAVHLLPYHNIQTAKYNKIGKQYELSDVSGDESPNMKEIKNLFGTRFRTKVGG